MSNSTLYGALGAMCGWLTSLISKLTQDFTKWILLPSSEITKNTKKNFALSRNLLKNVYRYGIFWMLHTWWILMSRPFRICVAKGVGGVKGRDMDGLRWPSFQKKTKQKLRCQKEQARPQFSKYRFQKRPGQFSGSDFSVEFPQDTSSILLILGRTLLLRH